MGQIREIQDKIGKGTGFRQAQADLAYSPSSYNNIKNNLYPSVLNRTGDEEGVKNAQNDLAGGKSLSDLRHEMAFSQEATSRLTQQTADLIREAGIEQSVVWSGVPEALAGLQGNIAAGQATMGRVQTAIERGVYATNFQGSTVSPASLFRAFSLVAIRSIPAVEGLSAAAMAESATVIAAEVAAGSVVIGAAAPIVAAAAISTAAVTAAVMLWPTVSSWIHGGNDKPIPGDDWGKREKFIANVKAAIAQSNNTDWADVMNGGGDQAPRDKLQIDHCVPLEQKSSEETRAILNTWKIDINSPAIHGGKDSSKSYGSKINVYMQVASQQAETISRAAGGGDAGFKEARNYVMNSLRTFCDNLTYDSGDTKAKLAQTIMRTAEKAFIGKDNQS